MSFARFLLDRLPDLAERLRQPDATKWLAAQDSVEVDGERLWIMSGDRLIDEAEVKLEWAREHRLVDEAELRRLEAEYQRDDPDTIAVDPNADQ